MNLYLRYRVLGRTKRCLNHSASSSVVPETSLTANTGDMVYTIVHLREAFECPGKSVDLWTNVFDLLPGCWKARRWRWCVGSLASRGLPDTRSSIVIAAVVCRGWTIAVAGPIVTPIGCRTRWSARSWASSAHIRAGAPRDELAPGPSGNAETTLSHLSGLDLQMYAFPFLQVASYSKQIPHMGISFRPEHTHKAFTGFSAGQR